MNSHPPIAVARAGGSTLYFRLDSDIRSERSNVRNHHHRSLDGTRLERPLHLPDRTSDVARRTQLGRTAASDRDELNISTQTGIPSTPSCCP